MNTSSHIGLTIGLFPSSGPVKHHYGGEACAATVDNAMPSVIYLTPKEGVLCRDGELVCGFNFVRVPSNVTGDDGDFGRVSARSTPANLFNRVTLSGDIVTDVGHPAAYLHRSLRAESAARGDVVMFKLDGTQLIP